MLTPASPGRRRCPAYQHQRPPRDRRAGDYQYAISLAGRLSGWATARPCSIATRRRSFPASAMPSSASSGPHLDEPVPGVPNLLWMISPPDLLPAGGTGALSASVLCLGPLCGLCRGGMRSSALLQCADGDTFNAQANDGLPPVHDIAFVGSLAPRATGQCAHGGRSGL